MTKSTAALLRRLGRAGRRYGGGSAEAKLALLQAVERRRLATPGQVSRFHEVLCFLRAYPDDRTVLAVVEGALERFSARADLRRHRDALADSGIAGTTIHYRFFWPQASWLAGRSPGALHLDRDDPESEERLRAMLPALVSPAERELMLHRRWGGFRTLDALRAADETDAALLMRLIARMPGDDRVREAFHDTIDLPYRIEPNVGTPSRTSAKCRGWPVIFRNEPPSRKRPDLRTAVLRAPTIIRRARGREARELIEMAKEAMVTRSRELEVFSYANPRDVHVVDDGDGLRFAGMGFLPERRMLLHAAYGFLTLRNGVPIGYVQVDALGPAAGISYNTFDTYRGGEAAWIFGRVLAVARHMFGSRSFSIEPYQLGAGNAEGLASGAWWFYYKLGFRPRDTRVRRVVRRELGRMRRDPSHRSDQGTLLELASAHLFFETEAVRPRMPPPPWVFETTRGEPDRAPSFLGWTAAERRAWRRWEPIVASLPGTRAWSHHEWQRLHAVVQAKGGPSELPYLAAFEAHPKLLGSLLRLSPSR